MKTLDAYQAEIDGLSDAESIFAVMQEAARCAPTGVFMALSWEIEERSESPLFARVFDMLERMEWPQDEAAPADEIEPAPATFRISVNAGNSTIDLVEMDSAREAFRYASRRMREHAKDFSIVSAIFTRVERGGREAFLGVGARVHGFAPVWRPAWRSPATVFPSC